MNERVQIFKENLGTSDCAVVAIMALLDISYEEAEVLATKHGYVQGDGMWKDDTWNAIRKAKAKVEPIEVPYRATAASFASSHPRGRFILHVSGHVMPLIDGDLFNSRGHWGAPVYHVARVITPDGGLD